VHEYSQSVRRDRYELGINTRDEHRSLRALLLATDSIEITWLDLEEDSSLVGHTLQEANIRSLTGASMVALLRGQNLIANPKSHVQFQPGDRVGLIGEREQIEAARTWILSSPRPLDLEAASGEQV
jgi:CPA2 family monovalent cation:H+ antiporter-2